jgi:hypothetical protein
MKNKNVLIINIIVIYLLGFFVTGRIFGQQKIDNAAILYYQAFILCPDEDTFSVEFLTFGYGHTDSSPKLLQFHIDNNNTLLKLITRATEIKDCNWLTQGQNTADEISSKIHIRALIALLGADARNCAINGDYINAFDKCITLLRFSKHMELLDGVGFFQISEINRTAILCIGKILDIMPPDEKKLQYIKNILAEEEKEVRQSFKELMLDDLEYGIKLVSAMDIKRVIEERPTKDPNSEKYKKELLNMNEEDIIKIIRQDFNNIFKSIFEIVESDNSYSQKYIKIRDINKDFEQQAENNPAIPSEIVYEGLENIYNLNIRYIAYINSLRDAVEIYLVKARTGQLPKQLPEGLAKDPYSGHDFEYILTDKGFKLRCREKDIGSNKFGEFEFKVK